ncbi:hypothetical protein K9L67_03620 [Candidatus Woesearchaeota archaeon]|nr:hypothetical protein [Candidatus Woesearchaeota archaeon]MCF7901290.1 hypothetical protein [Candidatus Woesearchaeota archaeon]MCF8013769.1 hypothetical protein [Candidatus Woesearchaeota archaeon]
MRNKQLIFLIFLILMIFNAISVNADTLVLNLNGQEFSEGESVKVFGYLLDDALEEQQDSTISIYYDGTYQNSTTTDTVGYFEYFINNVTIGQHNVTANSSNATQILTFNVSQAKTTYQIIAPSLTVPKRNTTLNFTIKEYQGTTLTSNTYAYSVYYENGTEYGNGTGISGTPETYILPGVVGTYTIVINNKKSFTASVTQFTLKFKITDAAGNPKNKFKLNGIAYFEVEGYSNGQKITNASVTSRIKDPTGSVKTVTFTENNGLYKGNTNVTQTTPIQLRSGDYEAEFIMRDSSNNEQKVKGFFKVVGLSVTVDLVDKKPYVTGDQAEFDLVVKNLADGTLLENDEVEYFFELEKNGKFYDVSGIQVTSDDDPALTSVATIQIPTSFDDGNYFLKVKATSSGKTGTGTEYLEIENTQLYIKLTDYFDGFRDIYNPGESAKIKFESEDIITFAELKIYNKNGVLKSTTNTTPASQTGEISFNVPTIQGEYKAQLTATMTGGETITRHRWFSVQNYHSFMEIKNLENEFQFIHASGDSFLGEINVFNIETGSSADLTGFTVKIDKIINEETQQEFNNVIATKNTTLSDDEAGIVVYKINPSTLSNGIYRIEYTLVDTSGKSFKGKGWFGVSSYQVDVSTYDSNGQQQEIFASGESIEIRVTLSSAIDGNATLHREFYPEATFNITNGTGTLTLSSSSSLDSKKLPSESGFYGFGIEIESNNGETGFGDGFYEIRNLNFRSINVRNTAQFAPGEDIIADVTIEKQGDVTNQTNVTVSRIVRISDWQDVTSNTNFAGATLTNELGLTTITIPQTTNLENGEYFVELQATKGTDKAYGGFSFKILQDKVLITINDADKEFTQTENIEINVKVTYQNDTPKNNITVNLTGLMNFNTWAPVTTNKQASTSTNGVATITISAANFNLARYAPIVSVEGVSQTIIGFKDGEFEIKPFDTTINFVNNQESYSIGEDILVDIDVTGDVSIEATIENDQLQTVDNVDYYYANNQLTINNDLEPGPYFLELAITQNSKTITKTLWFDVLAPWLHFEPTFDSSYTSNENISINYTVFTNGIDNGMQSANATINVTSYENLWTGDEVTLGIIFNGSGNSIFLFNASEYNLDQGDYLLNMEIIGNENSENSYYFRIDNNINIYADVEPQQNNNNVSINFSGLGSLSGAQIWLEDYWNYESWTFTETNQLIGTASGDPTTINLANLNLANGFYEMNFKINTSTEEYYHKVFFEIREKAVDIQAPETSTTNENVTFNITSTNTTTTFWIIDPFTQEVLKKQSITPGTTQITYAFTYSGFFMYSFGNTKWDAFPNAEQIRITQAGFEVVWPENNRFVLTENRNFTFNVTSDLNNTNLTLKFKNHFAGTKQTHYGLTTDAISGNLKTFSLNLSEVNGSGLQNGPHDLILTLQDGSTQPPKEFFFIDILANNYDVWAWSNEWEYQSGTPAQIQIEIYDVINNWNKTNPENVTIKEIKDPFWISMNESEYDFTWTPGTDTINITTNNFVTGNYHVELNITIGGLPRIVPVDFFVKGNDKLQLFWNQEKWDYSTTEDYSLTIKAKDDGVGVLGVTALLQGAQIEKWPENYNETPTPIPMTGKYNFTNGNQTNANGAVTFQMDLSGLETGGYTGRINVGGQIVWFDFQVRTYSVDAYTTEWEYGITDTIEINTRARTIENWQPIIEDGNIQITKILKHEPGNWEPEEVQLTSFGLSSSTFTVIDGESLIEMQPNQTALQLDKAYEFEVQLEMNLSGSGMSKGWAWFRLSNGSKPTATILDSTDQEPEVIFGDQTYKLQVTGANLATLKNIWGPGGGNYNEALTGNGTLELNFTTPQFPGRYTMEIEIVRSEGFNEWLYIDFTIGSGTEISTFMPNGENIIPDVNFTVVTELFGESDEDPFCSECNSGSWFGPLANKTIILAGIKNLQTFEYTDLTNQNINQTTNEFPEWMIGGSQTTDCPSINEESTCNLEDSCNWNTDFCEFSDQGGMGPEGNEEMGQYEMPGMATFSLNPTTLNLEQGKKYDLVFQYTDDSGQTHEQTQYVQVEQFHVAISKNTENLKPKSTQNVWLMIANLEGEPLQNCSVNFSGIYDKKNYQLVKSLNITGLTNTNGTYEFTYVVPSLPGQYLVEGMSTCDINNTNKTQEITYFIDIGSKSLEVDMKAKFVPGENIKIDITTKDRNGLGISQKLDLNLFHDFEDLQESITSTSGFDCTELKAAASWQNGGGWSQDSNLQVQTDENGRLILELCPLPKGAYFVDMFPIFDFTEFQDQRENENNGYFQDFRVSSGNIDITSDFKYEIGDQVNLQITVTDEYGAPVEGNLVYVDAILESLGDWSGIFINESEDNLSTALVNGTVEYNFTIPTQGIDERTENLTNLTLGTVDVLVIIEGDDGTEYSKDGLQFVIVDDAVSTVTADNILGVNELIDITVEAPNDKNYKAMMGVFFLQDNAEKEKQWFIEGGVFLRNDSENNKSYANFKILSPKEPGDYYLGLPLLDLSSTMESEDWDKLLITPITVKLDTKIVNGTINYLSSQNPVEGAKVKIGKAETTTDQNGEFSLEVAKGFKKLIVEKRTTQGTQFVVESKNLLNITQNIDNLTVKIYDLEMNSTLNESTVVITPATNLSTKFLSINTTINNTGSSLIDLDNAQLTIIAATTSETTINITVNTTTLQEQTVKPENTSNEIGNPYKVLIQLKHDTNNLVPLIIQDSITKNATIKTVIKRDYYVNSSITNTQTFTDYCGNDHCSFNESITGSCSQDCGGGADVCGDGQVTGYERCDGNNTNAQTCSNFGFDSGTISCSNNCNYFILDQCVWSGDSQNHSGNESGNESINFTELTINTVNTLNTSSKLVLEFQLADLAESPVCGGNSILDEEYEEWVVGINTTTNGCDGQECWLGEDYAAIISVNSSGGEETEFEYWNGTSLEINESVNIDYVFDCATNKVHMNVSLQDIGMECGEINVRYETWFGDDSSFLYEMADSQLDTLIMPCLGEGNQQGNLSITNYPELNLINDTEQITNDSTYLFAEITVENLSGMPLCQPNPDLPLGESREWIMYLDTIPQTGCNNLECTGTEDYSLIFEMNNIGGQDIILEQWNGSDFEDTGSVDLGAQANCTTQKISFQTRKDDTNITSCENISINFQTYFLNSTTDQVMDQTAPYTYSLETPSCLQQGNESGNESMRVSLVSPMMDESLNVSNVTVTYNITGNSSQYQQTRISLIGRQAQGTVSKTSMDAQGISMVYFENVVPGEYEVNIQLINNSNQTIQNDSTIFSTKWTYITCFGTTPDSAIMYIDNSPRQNCQPINPYGIEQGIHNITINKTGYDSYIANNIYLDYTNSFNSPYSINISLNISGNQSGNESGNESSSINITVSKYVLNSTIENSSIATFYVNVTNIGIVNATQVELVDRYSSNPSNILNFNSASINPDYQNDTTGIIMWHLNLSAGQNEIIEINFSTINPGNATNNVTIFDNESNFLSFDQTNMEIYLPGQSQQPGLQGSVTGSIIEDAVIEIINQSNMQIITTVNTTNESTYNVSLEPGIYDLRISMPQDYEYSEIQLRVLGINITNRETLNVQVPHLSGGLLINNVPVVSIPYVAVNNTMNVSAIFNNSDTFDMNVSYAVNASLIGDLAIFSGESDIINNDFTILTYQINPSIIGINELMFDFFINMDQSNVLSGTAITGQQSLDVSLNNVNIPINVTTGG